MNVHRELLAGLGSALLTAAGLFTLQLWYSSYLDVAVVHGGRSDVSMSAKLEAVRNDEHAQLTSGRLPIARAMEALAQQGRNAFPQLAAKPSADLSAMSGWIHKPGFKVYVPRSPAAPAAEQTPLPQAVAAAAQGGEEPR
jgi:hypothetical protein